MLWQVKSKPIFSYFHRAFYSQMTLKLELINLTYSPFICNLVNMRTIHPAVTEVLISRFKVSPVAMVTTV